MIPPQQQQHSITPNNNKNYKMVAQGASKRILIKGTILLSLMIYVIKLSTTTTTISPIIEGTNIHKEGRVEEDKKGTIPSKWECPC